MAGDRRQVLNRQQHTYIEKMQLLQGWVVQIQALISNFPKTFRYEVPLFYQRFPTKVLFFVIWKLEE